MVEHLPAWTITFLGKGIILDILPRLNASGIYSIVNLLDGKLYIGSAVNIRARWYEHRQDLRDGTHHCKPLQHAFAKYGAESFVFRVIEYCDADHCVNREQYWMDRTECFNRQKGYNIRAFAWSALGYEATPETRAKLSAANMGKKPSEENRQAFIKRMAGRKKTPQEIEAHRSKMAGRKMSPEAVEKSRLARTGTKRTPEQRARMAAAYIYRPPSIEATARRIQSLKSGQTRANMRDGHKKRKQDLADL